MLCITCRAVHAPAPPSIQFPTQPSPCHTTAAIFGGLDFAQALAAEDPRYVKMKASAQVQREDLCAPLPAQVLLGAAPAAAGTRRAVAFHCWTAGSRFHPAGPFTLLG